MFKRIRTKLAAVLAIPLVILVGISYFEGNSSLGQSRSVKAQTNLATASVGPDGLIADLQTERNEAALQVVGVDPRVPLGVANAAQARVRVDRAAATLQASVSQHGAAAVQAFRPAFNAFSHIATVRTQLDGLHATSPAAAPEAADVAAHLFQQYTVIVQAFFDANSTIASSVDNAQLRNGIELLDATLRQQESQSRAINDVFQASVAGGVTADGQLQPLVTDLANYQSWTARLSVLGAGPYATPVRAYVTGKSTVDFNRLMSSYQQGAPIDLGAVLATRSAGTAPGRTALAPAVTLRSQLGRLVSQQANHLNTAAHIHLALFILLSLVAAGLAIFVVIVASRSITGPLQELAEQANAMATVTLPTAVQSILDSPLGEDVSVPVVAPITSSTHDEVADVAAALTIVQNSAVDLAVEQAVLRRNIADSFVNLGRRNQNLLGRQLDFISALEQKETEPDKLEELFRLDHLATRMRRNAESLLVLAGLESPRQWSMPVAVSDVLRASLAEVEEYQRVSVGQVDPAQLPGSAAADVAHIVAELVENAIASSPPDQAVEVYGRGGERDYQITVIDHGVGMSAGDRERANRRLGGSESFTIAPSRYLGHYVAGHLAARYGISVVLQESDSGGIKAKVSLPAALFDESTMPPSSVSSTVAPESPTLAGKTYDAGPSAGRNGHTAAAESAVAVAQSPGPGAVLTAPVAVLTSPLLDELPSPVAPRPPVAEPVPVEAAPEAGVAVEAQVATEAGAESPELAVTTTPGGLVRRVRGATIADGADDDLLLRRAVDDDTAVDDEEAPATTSAPEVYRMLSSLWSDAGGKSSPSGPGRADREGKT